MKLKFRNDEERDAVVEYLSRLSFGKGQSYDVDVKRTKTKRSNNQNALYHMWLRCMATETGNSVDTIEKVLKKKFLGFDTKECMGEVVGELKGTHDLSTEQMTEFLNNIQSFAADYGILLPQPEDKIFAQFASQFED